MLPQKHLIFNCVAGDVPGVKIKNNDHIRVQHSQYHGKTIEGINILTKVKKWLTLATHPQ